MSEDKKPMPADGSGTTTRAPDDNGEVASRRDSHMAGGRENPGESGGGHYPHPYDGSKGQDPPEPLDERDEIGDDS